MRPLRLRAVWLLAIPFLWLATPAPGPLTLGAGLALVGLVIRGWAAGTISKDRRLTTSGPYVYTRNPLYLGSLLVGLGATLAGGHWVWPTLFLVFYGVVYGRTMAGEAALLAELFGDSYEDYAAKVPPFLPRLTPYREVNGAEGGFTLARYRRHKEWHAALGALAGFAFLTGKWWFSGG